MAASFAHKIKADISNYVKDEKLNQVNALLQSNVSLHSTSSMGRLFDAVSAILGLCQYAEHNAQAPIALQEAKKDLDAPIFSLKRKSRSRRPQVRERIEYDFAPGTKLDCSVGSVATANRETVGARSVSLRDDAADRSRLAALPGPRPGSRTTEQ